MNHTPSDLNNRGQIGGSSNLQGMTMVKKVSLSTAALTVPASQPSISRQWARPLNSWAKPSRTTASSRIVTPV